MVQKREVFTNNMDSNLTKTEQLILDDILSGNYTFKEIWYRRQCSQTVLYKHIRNLNKKGWGINTKTIGSKKAMPAIMPLGSRYYRLHNLHFIVTPYYFYERYSKEVGKSFFLGKWHITINTETIEMQTKTKASFDSQDIDETARLCREALQAVLPKIENRLGCEIIKEDKLNIRLVNHHLAEVENGIAKLMKGKKLEICDEHGKVWALIDRSKKVPESETVDPILATDDGKKLERHYNAMRDPKSFTVGEIKEMLVEIVQDRKYHAENIKTHIGVLQELKGYVRELREDRKERSRFLSGPSRPASSGQLSLSQFYGG